MNTRMTRWVRYYSWPYFMLRELGWTQLDQIITHVDLIGETVLWVKMQKPEETNAGKV